MCCKLHALVVAGLIAVLLGQAHGLDFVSVNYR